MIPAGTGADSMIHATLRENGETLHHIQAEHMTGLLDTAGLLAEALNYRNGFNASGTEPHESVPYSLSVVYALGNGRMVVDEYTIRAKGAFWLIVNGVPR